MGQQDHHRNVEKSPHYATAKEQFIFLFDESFMFSAQRSHETCVQANGENNVFLNHRNNAGSDVTTQYWRENSGGKQTALLPHS